MTLVFNPHTLEPCARYRALASVVALIVIFVFAATASHAAPAKLSGSLAVGGNVTFAAISTPANAFNARVVFVAD